jgi:hypothetical protein
VIPQSATLELSVRALDRGVRELPAVLENLPRRFCRWQSSCLE